MSPSFAELVEGLATAGYIADEGTATAVQLALALDKPLLVEGAPGVGKTSIAQALAAMLGRRLIRLQCHDGIDAGQALYEWNHARQLLAIRAHQAGPLEALYGDDYLIERPLLAALRAGAQCVLLIDEIDRADDAFEAFLLEFLGEGQITIPERGTLKATTRPLAVLTSNRTRELHEALRRRCLYHWIDYPAPEREAAIVRLHNPSLPERAATSLVAAVGGARRLPLLKKPGVSESIDWSRGAAALAANGTAWPEALRRSLGLLVKDQEDFDLMLREATRILEEAGV
ncbi:AAA family ATPase [Labrys wisconsinensis]|uniref:MoxR-like ATPase n=1 Tax=Labrys wisconsinensis TaxID=425677 RepID=A0ABU0J5T3_9HYPH|nr:MoxR family ATPase [Labrys wisconsinensis]MDQ0469612.1 MoxR-like ATPase [Labrys wisconsinensis]